MCDLCVKRFRQLSVSVRLHLILLGKFNPLSSLEKSLTRTVFRTLYGVRRMPVEVHRIDITGSVSCKNSNTNTKSSTFSDNACYDVAWDHKRRCNRRSATVRKQKQTNTNSTFSKSSWTFSLQNGGVVFAGDRRCRAVGVVPEQPNELSLLEDSRVRQRQHDRAYQHDDSKPQRRSYAVQLLLHTALRCNWHSDTHRDSQRHAGTNLICLFVYF